MKLCQSCGNDNRDEARFCRSCGEPLASDTKPEVQPDSVNEAEESLETSAALEDADDSPPSSETESSAEEIASDSPGDAIPPVQAPSTEQASPLMPQPSPNPKSTSPSSEAEPILEDRITQAEPAGIEFGMDTSDNEPGQPDQDAGRSLSAGQILLARYRILSIVDQDETSTLYDAEDLLQCWNCGQIQTVMGEVYCEDCGAALEQIITVRLRATFIPGTGGENELSDGDFVEGDYLYQLVSPQVVATDPLPQAFQCFVGFQSDVGQLRETDEDSLLVLQLNALCEMRGMPSLGFFAVADGIGGNEAGEIASRIAVRSLAANVMERIFLPQITGQSLSNKDLKSQLKEAILTANLDVLNARRESDIDMGCTLTAALVCDDYAFIANVGDSRTYLMRMGTLSKITEDHSLVAKMLAENLIQPEEVYTHEQKSVIYRSLGDKPDLEIDDSLFDITLEAGDRLVLCCDGVWEMVQDSLIEDILLEYHDPQAACDRLVEMSNLAGGDDNISVVVVNFQTLKRFR